MISSSGKPKSASIRWIWNGKQYNLPISAEDILMLARAVQEEGYPQEGVAWALLQRVAWLNTTGTPYKLGKLVQDYAQPINPEWFPTGKKHQAEVLRLKEAGDFQEAQAEVNRAARRPAKAARSWESLNTETQNVIRRIMSGASKSPVPGAVHYWASRGPDFATNQAKKPGMILLDRGYGFGPGRNVFFAVKGSEKFGGLRIDSGSQGFPWGSLAIAVGGFIAFKIWKG